MSNHMNGGLLSNRHDEEFQETPTEMTIIDNRGFTEKNIRFREDYDRSKKNSCFMDNRLVLIVTFILCLGAFIGVGLPMTLEKYHWKTNTDLRRECQLPSDYRVDCLPDQWNDNTYTKEVCEAKSCCWDVYENPNGQIVPRCFHSLPSSYGYTVSEVDEEVCLRASGRQWPDIRSDFAYQKENKTYSHYRSKTVSAKPINQGSVSRGMKMQIDYVSEDYFVGKIFDLDGFTFEPDPYLKYESEVSVPYPNEGCKNDGNRKYDVRMSVKNQRLFINAVRRGGSSTRSVFNTDFGPFIFLEQYMEFTILLPSTNVYGLGQGNRVFLKHSFKEGTTRTLFNQIPSSNWDENDSNDTSIESWYGSHPFYLCIEPDGKAHGVLFAHTSALEITAYGVPSLTIRTNGRGMKFYVFMGPTPRDVIRQLTTVVGKPALPPSWALGHHVCRSFIGEMTSDSFDIITKTTDLFEEKRIPHTSDCVFEQVLGSPQSEYYNVTQYLKDKGVKLTLVHSPMMLEQSRSVEDERILVRNGDGKPYSGLYKGSKVNYLDVFRNNQSYEWVNKRLSVLANELSIQEFDGYILTDNTPIDETGYQICKANKLTNPPFVPGAAYNQTGPASVLTGTLCLDACHRESGCTLQMPQPTHYNLHNLYGHAHMESIYHAANGGSSKDPFVVSMSTFTGSGRYGGHWGGHLEPSWSNLKRALVQTLESNLYGMPLTGIPACGFKGPVDRDLCSRWAQLSAFQPLCMTYREVNSTNIEILHPYLDDSFVGSVAAGALQIRNALMPYFYTIFREASMSGDPLLRTLFYKWPTDSEVLDIDEQFLWGNDLMISPVLTKETTSIRAYFPEGTWYDFYDGTLISKGSGVWKTITALEYHINIHIRGGAIVSSLRSFTRGSLTRKLKLQVALDQRAKEGEKVLARGYIFLEELVTGDGSPFLLRMEATETSLTITPSEILPLQKIQFQINAVYVLGVKKNYKNCYVGKGGVINKVPCRFNSIQGVLSLSDLTLDVPSNIYTLSWNETSSPTLLV